MDSNFENVWNNIKDQLKIGDVIKNWTPVNGYFGNDVLISSVNKDSITIQTKSAKHPQLLKKYEFNEIWEVWSSYISGEIKRNELGANRFHTTYIIDILHWYERKENEKKNG